MPGPYVGGRAGTSLFAATTDLMHLFASTGECGMVTEVGWGSEATASAGMRTRITRPSTPGTSPTTSVDILVKRAQDSTGNIKLDCVTTVTSPTYSAGSLLPMQSWNAHGGSFIWKASPGEEIYVLGSTGNTHLTMRNEVGSATGSVGWSWIEP